MAITIKKAVLWRKELENRPGTLAAALRPLAEAGVNLQVVMGYAFPGEHEHAAVEVWPIDGNKAEMAAQDAGLNPSPRIACLIVTGDDTPGLGSKIADALAENGINISFVMVQAARREYHGVFGFETQEDADRAVPIIKEAARAAAPRRRKTARAAGSTAGARKTTARKSSGSKTSARKKTAKGSAGKKSSAKKTTGSAGRKSTAGTTTGRKTTARKTTARKSTARKTTARRKR